MLSLSQMDRVIINGRYFTVVEFVRTHVVSVKRGYTNLTEYRINANVSIDDGATTTQLGGDPILDEFEISQEDDSAQSSRPESPSVEVIPKRKSECIFHSCFR